MYYFAVRNASKEDREKFDSAMSEHSSTWHLRKAAPALKEARKKPTELGQNRARRMPPKPAGWGSAATNTFNSKAAIKTLTSGGVSGKNRRK